jgi:alpha-amylase/alpha-mannosidase (GH57 family)
MIWGNFLHIYQPPDQHKDLLKRIAQEAYYPIVEILEKNPQGKLTLNITACLTEQLLKLKYKDLIERIKNLLQKRQIELTDSAKYHAFLPLLPENEIERQIVLNHQTHKRIFGKIYSPKGLHLPEMAYSEKVAKVAKKLGYQWLVLNEISFEGKLFSKIDCSQVYKLKKFPTIKILFRNRKLSDLIQRGFMNKVEDFYKFLQENVKENEYIITAMDGETFGHHRPGLEKFLWQLYAENKVRTMTISEIVNTFPEGKEIKPIKGTWASMESEIKAKIPYAQWKYPKNPIHQRQWKLTYLAIQVVNKNQKDPGYKKARKILDKALFSCQYWWAGAVPWWEIEYIEKGAYYLKKSIETLKKTNKKTKKIAQKLYNEIISIAFDWERSGLAHKKSMEYTKKIIKELGEKIPEPSPLHSKK